MKARASRGLLGPGPSRGSKGPGTPLHPREEWDPKSGGSVVSSILILNRLGEKRFSVNVCCHTRRCEGISSAPEFTTCSGFELC